MNLTQLALATGGQVKPIIIPAADTGGTGTMNPSIFIDGDKILVNVRHINYILYHSEKGKFHHEWGPLQYLHPETDLTLTTYNYLCELNEDLDLVAHTKVETSLFDVKPLWEFVGLEDCRLFKWNDKLYLCGVRRDTTTNGQGRMELSEIIYRNHEAIEISRRRIPSPNGDNSYCEKNWYPILDRPYHFVKWTSPTEIVKVTDEGCQTVVYKEENRLPIFSDLRGGSQAIPFRDGYLAVVHETNLFNSELGRKNATYRHRFILFDQYFNIIRYSDRFSFMEGELEFCCGAAIKDNDILLTYGFQDNSAFILKMSLDVVDELCNIYRS
jgi:hypothetical protein